jgi:hypothetical protein
MRKMGLSAIAINKEVHLEPKVWDVSHQFDVYWFLLIAFVIV